MSKIIFCKLLILSFVIVTNSAIIEDSVLKSFQSNEKINILVDLVSPEKSLRTLNLQNVATREQRIENVVVALKSLTKSSQTNAIKLLDDHSINYQSFWISNQIFIKDATESLVQLLSEDPQVEKITEEIIITLDPLEILPTNPKQANQPIQWGVTKIGAPAVWDRYSRPGEGIVVGGIDSGVRSTHEVLRNNYRRQYGWANYIESSITPLDDSGHGTHTMATIVGQNGIGVAPNATWIACRACDRAGCPQNALLRCAQFMLCPSGNDYNCQAPHIVSNSWGGSPNRDYFNNAIRSWIAAGIVPVFSIGNNGAQGCSSAGSPGDQFEDLLSVGSTTNRDTLSTFSSRGPSAGRIKPFISAPGEVIYSASNFSDTRYATLQGTSMAAPHVAGAVALLLSDKPLRDSSYDNLLSSISKSAQTTGLTPPGTNCNGDDRSYPNNAFGYGRLNVTAALVEWRLTKAPPTTTTTTKAPSHSHINRPWFLPIFTISVFSFFLDKLCLL